MQSTQESAAGVFTRQRFAPYAWGVLAYNVLVILWGAYVRASGSGAGCGNHWPLCDGTVALVSPDTHKIIEFVHRAMTGIDTPAILLLIYWAFRAFPRFHLVRRAATLSGVFLVTEALIGALLVKIQHVAQNADAYTESAHLVNTLTLVACLTLTAWFASGHAAPKLRGKAAWMAAVTLGAVMVLSITGVIAALGDTLFPAPTLAAGLAQDFNPASSLLLRLRGLHPLIAVAVGTWIAFYAIGRLDIDKTAALRVVVLVGVQLAAGALNFLLRAPVWMQLAHLLIADLLWISLVLLCAATSPPTGSARSS
jgi:cytochrome c oxidase assembly protein subunit 15